MKNKTYKICLILFYLWIKTMWRHECMVGRSREQKKEVLLPLAGPHINRLACRHMGQQGRASRKPTEPQLPSGRRRGGKRQGEKRYSSRSSRISVVWHKETKRRSSKRPRLPGFTKRAQQRWRVLSKRVIAHLFREALLLLPTFVGQGQWEHLFCLNPSRTKNGLSATFNKFEETWDQEISPAGWVALVPSFMGQGQAGPA